MLSYPIISNRRGCDTHTYKRKPRKYTPIVWASISYTPSTFRWLHMSTMTIARWFHNSICHFFFEKKTVPWSSVSYFLLGEIMQTNYKQHSCMSSTTWRENLFIEVITLVNVELSAREFQITMFWSCPCLELLICPQNKPFILRNLS